MDSWSNRLPWSSINANTALPFFDRRTLHVLTGVHSRGIKKD
jgi:hypothetical protein